MIGPAQHTMTMQDDVERIACLRLIRTENIGPITYKRLIQGYGSAQTAIERLPELSKRGGRAKPLYPASMNDIEREYEALTAFGANILCYHDAAYPSLLRHVEDAPPVITYVGDLSLLQKPSIGFVGARNASLNGRKFAGQLARDLGAHGYAVTSGFARGIDTAAHEGAIETGTIAVFGGGIDVIFPPENKNLFDRMRECGLMMAECRFGEQPKAQHFPRRNRIISGLSHGVVVVEATMRSGSLITARMASEQGREVMAVPGHPMDPRAEGPNNLIQNGATLVMNADNIDAIIKPVMEQTIPRHDQKQFFDGFSEDIQGFDFSNENTAFDEGDLHAMILENLTFDPISVDELVRECQLSTHIVVSALLELELGGQIQRQPGNRVNKV